MNPLVAFAYCLFALSAIMTMVSYKVVSISAGAMLEASSYIFVFLFDRFVFRETASIKKYFAVITIVIGIIIAAG